LSSIDIGLRLLCLLGRGVELLVASCDATTPHFPEIALRSVRGGLLGTHGARQFSLGQRQ
jgi:hypothetical protein